jgi:tRNA-2-methylthio-N6-dimethylallyladenosine synthase
LYPADDAHLDTGQRHRFNAATVGRTLEVLFERDGRHPGQIVGKTPYLQTVQVDGPRRLIGEILPVAINSRGSNSLFGSLLESAAAA